MQQRGNGGVMTWMRHGLFVKVVFGTILAAFLLFIAVQWGAQGGFGGAGGAAATVNGERISSQEFYVIYNQELEGPMQPVRSSMTEADERDLRKTVLDRLVDQTLLWQEARRLKYGVTPAEVEGQIHAMPVFMNPETRQFDPYRYQAALQRLGVSAQLFSLEQERSMCTARLEGVLREAVRCTDLELWLEYLRWHRKMKATILKFPLAEAKEKLSVPAADVKDYWTQNHKEFEKVERVRIRHIVVAASPQAGPEAGAQAKAKMDTILAEIRKGADFADVARRRSDDQNTAQRGGDLGWRVKGELIPEYDSVVFKLGKGQLSQVFQTRFGWHLIKCDDHQHEEKPTFEELKGKIRDKILTARAKAALQAEALRAGMLAKKEKDLAHVAAAVARKAVVTGWFERGKEPPAGLSAKTFDAVSEALAGLEPGEMTEVVETDDGYFLAQLTDEHHEHAPEVKFLKERPEIEPVLLARKQRAAFDAYVAKLRAKSKIHPFIDAS